MLLHGGGLSWWNYRAEAELLSDRFHVVLPILDGHAGSDADFTGIGENAERIISFIDSMYGGAVLLIGGLSLGAQVLLEILSRRRSVCRYAVVESASLIPSRIAPALIGPAVSSSYALIRQRWFAKAQFGYLHIRSDLFEDYYRDTAEISRDNMVSFLRANMAYAPGPGLGNNRSEARIVVGEREQRQMLRSAELLRRTLPNCRLEIKERLRHGEYSLNRPEAYVRELLEMIAGTKTEPAALGSAPADHRRGG